MNVTVENERGLTLVTVDLTRHPRLPRAVVVDLVTHHDGEADDPLVWLSPEQAHELGHALIAAGALVR